jgi:hypothetical protein
MTLPLAEAHHVAMRCPWGIVFYAGHFWLSDTASADVTCDGDASVMRAVYISRRDEWLAANPVEVVGERWK